MQVVCAMNTLTCASCCPHEHEHELQVAARMFSPANQETKPLQLEVRQLINPEQT